jgi:DNA-binding response OmpR family regulator
MKILIIDDEKEICQMLKTNLEAEGFVVDFVLSGEAGLELVGDSNYDLIILDYNLPAKSGSDVCGEIRSKNITTPIIILSVNPETTIKVQTLNVGADDYLTKPFSFEELLARMRALLRRPKKIKDEKLTISDLILDVKKHTVEKGKKDIHLTKKNLRYLNIY